MQCHQCGFNLPDSAKFCRSCGANQAVRPEPIPVPEAAVRQQAIEPASQSAPIPPKQTPINPAQDARSVARAPSSSSTPKIAIISVIVIALVGGVGYWAWTQKEAANEQASLLAKNQAEEKQRRADEEVKLKAAEEKARLEAAEKAAKEAEQKIADEPPTISQDGSLAPIVLSTYQEVGNIPREDGVDENYLPDMEAMDFSKNWKGKTISIRGEVNRGGGISVEDYYVDGCTSVLKGVGLGTIATVTGTLESRTRGGSGGEPIDLKNCQLIKSEPKPVISTENIRKSSFAAKSVGHVYSAGTVQMTVDKTLSKINEGEIAVCFGQTEPSFLVFNGNEAIINKTIGVSMCEFKLTFIDENTIDVTSVTKDCGEIGIKTAGKTKQFLIKQVKYEDCVSYVD